MLDPVSLTQQLVRLDTRAGNEKSAAALLAPILADAGFSVRSDEPEPGRVNLVARYGSRTPVTLTGHLDTVPADASGWSFDPLSGDIHGGRLRGRGSSDMKAGVACMVAAAAHRVSTHPTDTDVQLVLTFGEETGCEGAARLEGLTPSPVLLVAEPTANKIVLGHKGVLWLRLTAEGRSAHGSRPELGDNALARLAAAAVRIHDHKDWPRSDTHGAATVNVGTFHAGVQPNLVPDHAELMLDIRTIPGFSSDDALLAIERLAGPGTGIERVLDLNGVATDPATALVRDLADALRPAEADGRPEYATYFTDASVLAGKLDARAVVIYGPGDPDQAHVTDETCAVAAIPEAAEAVHRLLASWGAMADSASHSR
ncbi:M20 family metallopeptidase [Streptomyces sp. NBC_00440]|uniref:M20 family metallopeptidase n=1 Tax=unclassified Streptomyces TaxID=2593676 RepID=UPI002E1F82CE|nr:M20 family metallopeptidase [Streptomyces sp. NBC_00932]